MRQITLLSAIIGSGLVLMAGCTSNSTSQKEKAYAPHILGLDQIRLVQSPYQSRSKSLWHDLRRSP